MSSALLKCHQAVTLICISMIINEVSHLSLGLLPENQADSGGAQHWSWNNGFISPISGSWVSEMRVLVGMECREVGLASRFAHGE